MQISPFFLNWAIFLFLRNCNFYDQLTIGLWTSCRPIQSVIILVINKSDSRCAVVRFCYHSYDYRSNWIQNKLSFILPAQTGQHVPSVFVWFTQERTGQVLMAQVIKLSCIIKTPKQTIFTLSTYVRQKIAWNNFTFPFDLSILTERHYQAKQED